MTSNLYPPRNAERRHHLGLGALFAACGHQANNEAAATTSQRRAKPPRRLRQHLTLLLLPLLRARHYPRLFRRIKGTDGGGTAKLMHMV